MSAASPVARRRRCAVAAACVLGLGAAVGQAQIAPSRATLIESAIGARVDALTILGGDFGLSDGNFHSTGSLVPGQAADVDTRITKIGGDGDVGDPRPLDGWPIGWQPELQGSMGFLQSANHLQTALLGGDTAELRTFAVEFGGGARFWTTDRLSFAPTAMLLYGHTSDTYMAQSAFGRENLAELRQLGLADWSVDTWTLRPALDIQYVLPLGRTLITLSSDPTGFFTHGFARSNHAVSVGGDSGFVTNKIDIDIPLGIEVDGHELRTGGYLSRTDLLGDLETGLGVEHINELHGRIVLDFLNQLWKVQWLGVGASYLWGPHIDGWTMGADVAFRF